MSETKLKIASDISLEQLSIIYASENKQKFNLSSTLRDLKFKDFQVDISQMGKVIFEQMNADKNLPGAIVLENNKLIGMISRQRFLERMSRPYSLELFLKRPVKYLYRFVQTEMLVLPGDTLIVEAANQSLQRPQELIDEPIVVEVAPKTYGLIEAHQILIAQSQIFKLTTDLLSELYHQLNGANQKLERLVSLDSVTQVSNRRMFDTYLTREWQRLEKEQGWISLILCDLDYFKQYNDTYGHLVGDDCLRAVAHAIQKVEKKTGDLVARYGGEEFALILPNTDRHHATKIAENIRMAVRSLKIFHSQSPISQYLTITLGIASTIPSSKKITPANLIVAADQALYQAKKAGRDRAICNSVVFGDFIVQNANIAVDS